MATQFVIGGDNGILVRRKTRLWRAILQRCWICAARNQRKIARRAHPIHSPIYSMSKSFIELPQLLRPMIKTAVFKKAMQPNFCFRVDLFMLKSREPTL